jgi:hypothetical protein
MENYGFAVLPLISGFQQRNYFNSGLFQLPVYKGPVSQKLLQILAKEPETESKKIIADMYKFGELVYLGGVQVIAKAVDAQRGNHFSKP